jgi:DNA polymerase III epsilon subunit-like protein
MDHVFIKVVCTSQDVDEADIVEIAAIRTDRKGSILGTATSMVRPNRDVENAVIKRLGYEPADVLDAPRFTWAAEHIRTTLLGARYANEEFITVGHFAEYVERPVLRRECKRISIPELFGIGLWVDTGAMAWPLVECDLVSQRTLIALARHYHIITSELPPTAISEVAMLSQIYWEMMRRYKTSLRVEETVRSYGGPTLESVRRVIGF